MTSQIPYGEAWLLETLAMLRLPVWCLTRNERAMRDWLNRGFHRLPPAELKQTIRTLFDFGDIEAFIDGEDDGFIPTTSQLEAAFRKEDKTLYCGVTVRGGMRWESLARPNWIRYFEDVGWDGEAVEITAGSREQLTQIVSGSALLWHVAMDAAELDIECVRPWDALPWKSLPVGFRATVPYTQLPFEPKSREELEADQKKEWPRHVQLRTWATSICGQPYV